MLKPQVNVIIPALNEAGNIQQLVAAVQRVAAMPRLAALQFEVLVVDNGSTDATGAEASQAGARVVYEPRRGYGFACAAGLAASPCADWLVFLDGDQSFAPAELPILLAPLQQGRADLVLGSRLRAAGLLAPGAMLAHQRFGNWLVAQLVWRLYRVPISDLGPYRAVRRDLVAALDMREMTYGWPTEMIVKAARHGARIVEVPVTYRARGAGHSKVSGTVRGTVLATYHILRTTFSYAWR